MVLVQTITIYRRAYPIDGAPVSFSLRPYPSHMRCTYTAGNKVYEAVFQQFTVSVPDDAIVLVEKNLLAWSGKNGKMQSTAAEVLSLIEERTSGFHKA
jgi:hypothetical protein